MTESGKNRIFGEWTSNWIAPGMRRLANGLLGRRIVYRGPFRDFESARRSTLGYAEAAILEEVEWATGEVLGGRAQYQQDGRTFYSAPPADLALSGLLLGAARSSGRLSVLDFGGSLGSHFLRWQSLLAPLPGLMWCVVEQPHFVAAGRKRFASQSRLRFEASIEQAATFAPNVIFASSVLQYLPDPDGVLDTLSELGADVMVIDRLPVARSGQRRVMTQHMQAKQGQASYPLHVFESGWLESRVGTRYQALQHFPARDDPIDSGGLHADYVGSIWLARP